MPFEWMDSTHRWLGMGELPRAPIVGYLARSVSGLYAFHGAFLLFVSLDVRRYLPLIRFVGLVGIFMGAILVGLDLASGMPVWWTTVEGPFVIVLSGIVLVLANRVQAPCK